MSREGSPVHKKSDSTLRSPKAFAEYVSRIQREVESLSNLEPNWDGYGAPKISLSAIRHASQAARLFGVLYPHLPAVVPTSSEKGLGGVQFEWNFGGRSLEMDFKGGVVRWLRCPTSDPATWSEDACSWYNYAEILRLAAWLAVAATE